MPPVLPEIDDLNRPYWDGCRGGLLRLQRCVRCGRLRYPVSLFCPECLSPDATWEDLSGRGQVFSFVVFRHSYNDAWTERLPYTVALVQLAEGPTVIGNVVGVAPESVRVGLAVRAVFEPVTDEIWRACFEPEGERPG